MAKRERVSLAVIKRLPRYYRYLGELMKNDILRISSGELGQRMSLTASQIRQDLNCFGGFGQQGYGYNVSQLHDEIGRILGLDKTLKAVLVGVGNLGRAIINHVSFDKMGFSLIGAFDVKEELVGQQIKGIPIMHVDRLESFCREHSPDMAVLTLPRSDGPAIAERLISLGVKGFWNFCNMNYRPADQSIIFENVYLIDSLMTLSYRLKNAPKPCSQGEKHS